MAQHKKDNNILPKVAAGAAVIGGVAAAATILSDKKKREDIKEGIDKVTEKGAEVLENIKQRTAQASNEALANAATEYEKVRKQLDDYTKDAKNSDGAKRLKDFANKLSNDIEEAKLRGEDVGRDTVDKIKNDLQKLGSDLKGMMEERA